MGGSKKKKINLEKFLIFNQQFVTLIRAGLPISKGLDLLADRLTDAARPLHPRRSGRRQKRRLLSDAFAAKAFSRRSTSPPSWPARKAARCAEVLDRYITYQKLALAIRKKMMLSLVYPTLLLVPGGLPDRISGHLRRAQFRRVVQEHVRQAACRPRRS